MCYHALSSNTSIPRMRVFTAFLMRYNVSRAPSAPFFPVSPVKLCNKCRVMVLTFSLQNCWYLMFMSWRSLLLSTCDHNDMWLLLLSPVIPSCFLVLLWNYTTPSISSFLCNPSSCCSWFIMSDNQGWNHAVHQNRLWREGEVSDEAAKDVAYWLTAVNAISFPACSVSVWSQSQSDFCLSLSLISVWSQSQSDLHLSLSLISVSDSVSVWSHSQSLSDLSLSLISAFVWSQSQSDLSLSDAPDGFLTCPV